MRYLLIPLLKHAIIVVYKFGNYYTMQIQYYGLSAFRLSLKPAGRATDEVLVYLNGLEERYGLRAVYGTADVLLNSKKINKEIDSSQYKGDPVIFDCPGEYSVKGVNIVSIASNDKNNSMYLIEAEDIKIAHLGLIKEPLNENQYEAIDGVDILCIPIGGHSVIDAKQATNIIRKIEPSIVLPMYYKIKNAKVELDEMKKFCDEIGVCDVEQTQKLTIKKKDLENKNMDVVHIESLRS
jgi:hypothetical protein